MAIRITGMNSGLDTENIISELVKAKKSKVNTLTKAQKSLQVKQDALKELNSKVTKFYNNTVTNLMYAGSYSKKVTESSSSSAVSVTTNGDAMDGIYSLKIKSLATTANMTGGKVADGTKADTTLGSLIDPSAFDANGKASFTLTVGGVAKDIEITTDTKMSDLVSELNKSGVNANFDAANGRLYLSGKESGDKGDFSFGGSEEVLSALGLSSSTIANYKQGKDAEIELNGVSYTSSSNIFKINGLSIECKEADENKEITLTTKNDVNGIYDMVKNFVKGYSSLINEMDKLYNAESSKGYEPLLDEEKEAMSESEITKWEEKIKNSILRRDSSVSTLSSALKEVMNLGFEVNGKTMYLSNFGVEKMGFFNAAENEKNAFIINGDSDFGGITGAKDNDLKAMIESDPDSVISFFSSLNKAMDTKLKDIMKSSNYRSSYTIYDDKKMKSDYDDYTKKIKDAEAKLTAYEDKWYQKFSRMETALAKMQSNSSAITGLLGG